MARYFASAGIRKLQGNTNNQDILSSFPFLVIIGPSGQFAQVTGPSGTATKDPSFMSQFQAYEQTFNHRSLAWFRNEIVTAYRQLAETAGNVYTYAWQPYGQTEGIKSNDSGYVTSDGRIMSNRVMFDGKNWKQIAHSFDSSFRNSPAFLKIPGGAVFWVYPLSTTRTSFIYGTYKGDDPIFKLDTGGRDGWDPRPGQYGSISKSNDPNFRISDDGSATNGLLGGINNLINTQSDNICDALYHKGTIYVAGQSYLAGLNVGTKGNWIFHDNANDNSVNDLTITSDYIARATQQNYGGPLSRSLTVHNDRIYMLSNNGKVHEVLPGGLKEVANLANLGTIWSTGVVGGALPKVSTDWTGTTSFRCLLSSFNNQLHAFLNFQTTSQVAKATTGSTGKGVFWATSYDGMNWKDRSTLLPSSGIISPSGTGAATVNWLTTINPYRFSGFVGSNALPVISGVFPTSYGDTGIGSNISPSGNSPCQPSGFRQTGILPFWSSGNMVDVAGTSFDSLQVPLEFGAISGHMFPTLIAYPEGFGFQNGDFRASGVGPSGYDYTGCDNYHISGFTDEDNKLKLIFSRDFDEGPALFFELNKASGWNRRNYVTEAKQLNGIEPIELYDPEIIIPSGTIFNPNPKIDEVNKTVTIDYKLYHWPFWDSVNVKGEFSTDGEKWVTFKTDKNVSTGSLETDPSGIIGTTNTMVWNYTQDGSIVDRLSKGTFYPSVQIRLRAET